MATPPRVRQRRAVANDERILDVAVEMLANEGWLNFLPSRVGAEAGLSRQSVLRRFPDRCALATAVWQHRLSPDLSRILAEILSAAGLLADESDSGSAPTAASGTPEELVSALQPLLNVAVPMRSAAELLVIAHFEPALHEAITGTLGAQVTAWCTPGRHGPGPVLAAQRAYLLEQGLGLLIAGRRPGIADFDALSAATKLMQALNSPTDPVTLPRTVAKHLDERTVPFDTGDPIRDMLLQAALDGVSEHGFDGVSVQSIADAAGYSEGTLWNRWPSKLTLFEEATERHLALGLKANHDWLQNVTSQYGQGVAEAVHAREVQRPTRTHLRALNLEQARLAWHHPELSEGIELQLAQFVSGYQVAHPEWNVAEATTHLHFEWAFGFGAVVLPLLHREAWRLPYDVITTPMSRSASEPSA